MYQVSKLHYKLLVYNAGLELSTIAASWSVFSPPVYSSHITVSFTTPFPHSKSQVSTLRCDQNHSLFSI